MGRYHVSVAEDRFPRGLEPPEAPTPSIAFVALHHRRPLPSAHGRRPGVGQQVNEDLLGRQKKHVVVRPLELLAAIFRCGPANRFDGFDLEGLDDRPHGSSLGAWLARRAFSIEKDMKSRKTSHGDEERQILRTRLTCGADGRPHHQPKKPSIDSEAVEQAVSARATKILLTAASAPGRGVPPRRGFAAPGAVMMANSSAPLTAARPVLARRVSVTRKSRAVELRARQGVVAIGVVAAALDHLTLFVEHP